MNVSNCDWSCSLVSSASPKLDSYTRAEYTDWRSMALARSLYSAEDFTENAEDGQISRRRSFKQVAVVTILRLLGTKV